MKTARRQRHGESKHQVAQSQTAGAIGYRKNFPILFSRFDLVGKRETKADRLCPECCWIGLHTVKLIDVNLTALTQAMNDALKAHQNNQTITVRRHG